MSGTTDLVLRAGDVEASVSLAGGRLTGLAVAGLDVVGSAGHRLVDWGSYPMAPFAGRVRRGRLTWAGRTYQLPLLAPPHAMHGVTLDRPWQPLETGPAALTLRCDLDGRWPWPGHAVQHLTLAPDRLTARLEVHTTGDEPMPAWAGFHPWFRRRLDRGGPVEIAVDADGMLPRDGDGMPTTAAVAVPPGPWDDCFTGVRWPITLHWPGALRLRVGADTGYAVLFTEKDAAVCVEPQTAPPDAAALGLAATVAPGSPLTMTMTWAWDRAWDQTEDDPITPTRRTP